jgi:hypothetical protein
MRATEHKTQRKTLIIISPRCAVIVDSVDARYTRCHASQQFR